MRHMAVLYRDSNEKSNFNSVDIIFALATASIQKIYLNRHASVAKYRSIFTSRISVIGFTICVCFQNNSE